MASKTLGRTACPINCGHESAHVKLKTDKEDGKTAFPYVHCRGCGVQLHTRTEEQAQYLLRSTRPEKLDTPKQETPPARPEIAPPSIESTPVNTEGTPPAAKAAYTGRFGRWS